MSNNIQNPSEFSASFVNTKEIAKELLGRLGNVDNYTPVYAFLRWLVDTSQDHTVFPPYFEQDHLDDVWSIWRQFQKNLESQTTTAKLKLLFPDAKDEVIKNLSRSFVKSQSPESKYAVIKEAELALAYIKIHDLENKVFYQEAVVKEQVQKIVALDSQLRHLKSANDKSASDKQTTDNKTWQQAEDEYLSKPVYSSQEITQAAANNSVPIHDVGDVVMWKFTDLFAAVKFAISSIETYSGSNVLIANLCEYLETKPEFVKLLKTYVQNVEKYNRIITIRGMNSCLDVLEYNTKHGTDYDYVPNPGSLMEPRYGWEHIDPVTGAVSFRNTPQPLSMSETQPEEIKDTIVPEPKITNAELTKLYDRLSALECWVGASIAEQKEMIKTYAERAMFHGNGMFSIVKVAKLPNGRIPNAVYLVGEPDSDKFDLYVTGMNGELRALNTSKDEKEITRAVCKTLEISDPKAVKAWIKQTQAVAANIETYYKHCDSGSEMNTLVVTEKTSIKQMLEDTKTTLEQISADQDRIARNSISGAMVGNVNNIKTKSKEPDTGMELTGWRELSALAKHLNIDLSDTYVFLTSDGKVEIREHVMFPSKETLDQIGTSPSPTINSLTEHPMSKTALVHNVDILFMTIQGREQCVDSVEIGNYNEQIRDLFFAIERELAMRTESSVSEIEHSGYKVSVNYIPIPDAAPLCSRMFQIGKDGRNLSFAFYDSTPVRA